ncbi:MAG: hypothetical protein GF384_00840 [Elusimicrobia bacterium]|nr:hypothetical protein [Elusimicrobiota bacterium]
MEKKEYYVTLSMSVLRVSLVVWCLGVMGFSAWYHVGMNAKINEPISLTFSKARTLVPDSQGSILGPSLLWFAFRNQFRDIEALVYDYIYSGKKRPIQSIQRFKPDVIVFDHENRKRFAVDYDNESNQLLLDNNVIPARAGYVGSIEKNAHHTRLDFYQLAWDMAIRK